MSRFLRHPIFILSLPALAAGSLAACGDDTTTTQATSSSSSTSSSAGGGVSTSTVGGGGTGGVGGTGGEAPMACMGPDTGADLCDGDVVTVTLGTTVTLCGNIPENSNDDYSDGSCALATQGGDKVYNVSIPDEGTMKLYVRPDVDSDLVPVVHTRLPGGCTDPQQSAGCRDFPAPLKFAEDWDPTFLDGFHLFIDGGPDGVNPTSFGAYEVVIDLQPQACGDGVANIFTTTEQCDDGNTTNGDGCSSTCQIEAATLFDQCPGDPNPVGSMQPLMASANTTGNADDYSPDPVGSCMGVPTGGKERVYRLTATSTGTMTVTVGLDETCTSSVCAQTGPADPGCWDYVLYATTAPCGDTVNQQIACSDVTAAGPETISFPVVSGTDYFIYVDGYDEFNFGSYNICATVVP